MERLTKRTPAGVGVLISCGHTLNCTSCRGVCVAQDKANTRLADYEDTNLTPDQVKIVFEAFERTFGKGVSFDRIQELIKAEREGRILVTPPKAKAKKKPAGKLSEKALQALEQMGAQAHSKEGSK